LLVVACEVVESKVGTLIIIVVIVVAAAVQASLFHTCTTTTHQPQAGRETPARSFCHRAHAHYTTAAAATCGVGVLLSLIPGSQIHRRLAYPVIPPPPPPKNAKQCMQAHNG